MTWRAARCLDVLIKQVNTAHPTRPKQSDGLIGDQAHASRVSSHNPDAHGVVRGWDCTTAPFCQQLADELAHLGKTDERVWYVIWNRQIASREHGFTWRPYTGTDPHTSHIHLSVSDDPAIYDRTDPWPVLDRVTAHTASPPAALEETDMRIIHSHSHSYVRLPGLLKLDAKSLPVYRDKLKVPVTELTDDEFMAVVNAEKAGAK